MTDEGYRQPKLTSKRGFNDGDLLTNRYGGLCDCAPPIKPAFVVVHKTSDWSSPEVTAEMILEDMDELSKQVFRSRGQAKLTWRGIPEQRPEGGWREVWHAHVGGRIDHNDRGGRGLFTAELRECVGRDHTAILRDRDGRELGHFLTLAGAQNRARRHFEGRA